jgi:hypothetical protein
MLLFFLNFCVSRELESLNEKYRARLTANSSTVTEERVILESLASLGRQIDKSVTADEVKFEIASKIGEILDQITEADVLLRHDFNDIRAEIQATWEEVPQLINSAKKQILGDIWEFQIRLNGSLQTLLETATVDKEDWIDS